MNKTFILRERRHLEALLDFIAINWEDMSKTKNPMQVECKPESSKRNLQQNKYYWQILKQIETEAWVEGHQYSSEAWHEAAKRRFIGFVDVPGGGLMSISTTTLNTKEFAEYVTNVEAWAASELGVQFVGMEL